MDVLVVGSGIAGLTAALHARAAGHRVRMVTKDAIGSGCTPLAQGGVAGVYGPGDSPTLHADDTLTAGAGLSDPSAVDVLVTDAAARIAELIARGTAFDRAADGSLLLGQEAAHSHPRIVHAGGDATGAAISAALISAVRATAIEVTEHAFVVDLLVEGGVARGIRQLQHGRITDLSADAVILATGGAGALYTHTTNPPATTADGIAAAIRAGAAVADLEFLQFHPTVLADDTALAPFLISEAVRGEGATLLDENGHRFCFDVHPDGELAPRDVVARAIARQSAAQGSPVMLDATMLGAARLASRFPTIDAVTRQRGFDWAHEPLPVTPAAHYLMGGIVTDLDGRTTLPGLFAVGETARTGVHGANRLASNSLLEGAVFGARAAAALDTAVSDWPAAAPPAAAAPSPTPLLPHPVAQSTTRRSFDRAALQQLMWERVGLLRDDAGLAQAVAQLTRWSADAACSPAPRTRPEYEDANLLQVALAVASAALARTTLVGAHHREPVPALIGV